jgi:hypothetical protein
MSEKERCKRIARRTTGGSSAMVASKSQIRPYKKKFIFVNLGVPENCRHRTCFQRVRPKAKTPPPSQRRRSKPMSMMISNARSEDNELILEYLVLSKLVIMQAFASGDHEERSYGCQVSHASPKLFKLNIHPYRSYIIARCSEDSPVICRRCLPRRKREVSVNHITIAIAKIIFALFQMAILPTFLERLASEE